jgi:MYXO-CTERM domain-containing protein
LNRWTRPFPLCALLLSLMPRPAATAATEVCNGLDDDSNGQVDEGTLCTGTSACVCGQCAAACLSGTCLGGGAGVAGHCIKTPCPEGLVCNSSGACVPVRDGGVTGDDDQPGDGDTPSSTGCECATGAIPASAALLALGVLGVLLIRRKW